MPINPISGEIKAQPLNNNFSSLQSEITTHKAETKKDDPHGLAFKGVQVVINQNQSIESGETIIVSWDSTKVDTNAFFDHQEPTKIKIPIGVSKVRVLCNLDWDTDSNGSRECYIQRNGNFTIGYPRVVSCAAPTRPTMIGFSSFVIDVNEGDEIRLMVFQDSGQALDLRNIGTWLSLEVVE